MPETETTVPNQEDTGIEQGSLQTEFRRASEFFQIDLKPYENKPSQMRLTEIRQDPSIAPHLASALVYTDDILDVVFQDNLADRIKIFTGNEKLSPQDVYLADKENLRGPLLKASEEFRNNLQKAAPELLDLFDRELKQTKALENLGSPIHDSLSEEENRAIQSLNLASRLLNYYFVDTYFILDKPIETGTKDPLALDFTDNKPSPLTGTKTVVAFLPGSNFSFENAVAGQVNPDMLEYWAALRIGDSMVQTLPRFINADTQSNEFTVIVLQNTLNSHDTGYMLDEYLQTSFIPDYLDKATNITNFYQKTAEQYMQRTAEPLAEAGKSKKALEGMPPLAFRYG